MSVPAVSPRSDADELECDKCGQAVSLPVASIAVTTTCDRHQPGCEDTRDPIPL